MSLGTLKWFTILVPAVLAAVFLLSTRPLGHVLYETWWGFAIQMAVVVVGVSSFSLLVFRFLYRLEGHVLEQNQQLALLHQQAERHAQRLWGLHQAGLALTGELALEGLLQRIVDLSREIGDAEYAALIVLDQDVKTQTFLTSGFSDDERAKLKAPPQGEGILGVVLEQARPLRIKDVAEHPDAVGFPPGHPRMTNFLGIPILYKGKTLGGIYLTNKRGADEFTLEDHEALEMFATQAAVALENARLYQEIQTVAVISERERIAREMHDSLAQVLGYVSTKTQGIEEMVRNGDTSAAIEHLEQMEEAARRAYADVREGILALRSTGTNGRGVVASVREYAAQFTRQSGIPTEVEVEGDEESWQIGPLAEVQLLRIVQEALTNVRKHSRAKRAVIRLKSNAASLRLGIEDDGQGFNPLQIPRGEWPHLGLQAMQERAESIGATFELESSLGHGTKVVLTFPLSSDGLWRSRG